jgi:CheY-like chemotaxis protein
MTLYKSALLLEDDRDDQEIFQSAVRDRFPDLKCYVLNNGLEGLNFLVAGIVPDIIFSDLSMPLVDGKKFLKEYHTKKEYEPISPVIIFSTSQAKKDKEECIKLGASYYLVKPSTYLALLTELEFILSRPWPVS